MFSLLGHWHDDPEAEFERFAIPPLNLDLCCEEIYYDDLRISYVVGLLFYFREDELWQSFVDKFGIHARDFQEISKDPHPNIWKKQRTPETAAYTELFRLVDHSTGNPWLDGTHCQYADWYDWNKETIVELTKDYRKANRVFERLADLDEKIQTDPRGVLAELITFWNEGSLTADRQPSRRRNSCKKVKASEISRNH